MRILILSDINSKHTEKWVKGLCSEGIIVGLFSLSTPEEGWHIGLSGLAYCYAPRRHGKMSLKTKLTYLSRLTELKKAISAFNPDIVHAHYATSYGLLGKLTHFKPYIISVWGADVYDFPAKSKLKAVLLRRILKSADVICSTSNSMALETQKYTNKEIRTIPFGIRMEEFICANRRKLDLSGEITIGCIKMLTPKYGTNYLIECFSKILSERENLNLKLLLVGGGSHLEEYKKMVADLGITDRVVFTGNVPLTAVPAYHCTIDIFVSLSVLDSESFGVSLVEAMASGSHVVATRVSGFKEVMMNCNDYGLMVDPRSVDAAKDAVLKILDEPEEAMMRSRHALKSVQERYEWSNNLRSMCQVYDELLETE